MSDISQMIIDTIDKILKDLCTKEVVHASEQGMWANDLWNTLEETGLTKIGVPEESGGSGGSFEDAFTILQRSGQYAAPIPLAEALLGNWMLANAGLPLLDKPATIACTSEIEPIKLVKQPQGWILSGSASRVPWARYARRIVVIGQTEQGNAVAVVDSKDCKIKEGQNLAGEARDHVSFEKVPLSDKFVSQHTEMDETKFMYVGSLLRAIQMTGALERLLELVTSYSKERTQFGRPIRRFQAIQQQTAILAGEVAAAKSITKLALQAYITGSGEKEMMIAKIRVGEAASKSAPIAHQIHGAIGITDEYPLQQSTRRLWSWRDEFGTESEWANHLGQEVIEVGADRLWPFVTTMTSKKY